MLGANLDYFGNKAFKIREIFQGRLFTDSPKNFQFKFVLLTSIYFLTLFPKIIQIGAQRGDHGNVFSVEK